MTDCGLCRIQGYLGEKAYFFLRFYLTFNSGIRNIVYDKTKQRGKYGNND